MQRRGEALRSRGMTYASVALELGCSIHQAVYRLKPGEAARRRAAGLARAAALRAARDPTARRQPLGLALSLTVRLRGEPLERLQELARERSLRRCTMARLLLIESLERRRAEALVAAGE